MLTSDTQVAGAMIESKTVRGLGVKPLAPFLIFFCSDSDDIFLHTFHMILSNIKIPKEKCQMIKKIHLDNFFYSETVFHFLIIFRNAF